MEVVQITFDEYLLAELDETGDDVREEGRSAMVRQLTGDFRRQRREREIDAQYERAYAGVEDPLGKDFEGWDEEGVWPPSPTENLLTEITPLDEPQVEP